MQKPLEMWWRPKARTCWSSWFVERLEYDTRNSMLKMERRWVIACFEVVGVIKDLCLWWVKKLWKCGSNHYVKLWSSSHARACVVVLDIEMMLGDGLGRVVADYRFGCFHQFFLTTRHQHYFHGCGYDKSVQERECEWQLLNLEERDVKPFM